jgi:pyrroloquinoline quinone biosynthesis protein D
MAIAGPIAIARRFRLQYEEAQRAWVLLYPEGMVKLNDTAAEILRACDGQRDSAALIAELQRRFPGAELAAHVHEFLEVAHGRGWITGA